MKKQLILMVMLGLMIVAGSRLAQAQITDRLRAEIPFSFYAGTTLLPPGKYTVTMNNLGSGLMEIRSDDGKAAAFFMTDGDQKSSEPASSELIFNKYGEKVFLSQIFEEGSKDGAEIPKTKMEKRLVREYGETATVAIALR